VRGIPISFHWWDGILDYRVVGRNIARAIAMNPKYLFCDEPNSGLDPKTANLIDNLISEITQEYNITTVVNTHDMNSVLEIGDKISFINKG
jgi:phospholipid/cholesterol/gamma-HCH transport system ATP-binding protein